MKDLSVIRERYLRDELPIRLGGLAANLAHVDLSKLQEELQSLQLPFDTRVTVIIEENKRIKKDWNKQKALEAMKRLKGSGNGRLVAALLKEREKDKLYK